MESLVGITNITVRKNIIKNIYKEKIENEKGNNNNNNNNNYNNNNNNNNYNNNKKKKLYYKNL